MDDGEMIFGRIVMCALFLAFAQKAEAVSSVPQFREFPSGPIYAGPHAPPDLRSKDALTYRTRLREAAAGAPNYAGRYHFAVWGCGTGCETGAIVDLPTGQIHFLPFSICCSTKQVDPGFNAIEFRINSRLIVFSGKRNIDGLDASHFYVFDGNNFVYLKSSEPFAPIAPPADFVEPKGPSDAPSKTSETKCKDLSDAQARLDCYDDANGHARQVFTAENTSVRPDRAPAPSEGGNVEPPSNNSPTDALKESAEWRDWPKKGSFCPLSLVERYEGTLTWGESLYYLSRCAHSSAANISSYAYAMSQMGSSKKEAIKSLINFSNKIAGKPDATIFCFKSAGIDVFDKNGVWRDLTEILPEFASKLEKMDPSCAERLQ